MVDGNYIEYESYKSSQPKNAFRNMLHNGLAQSERIILRQCNLTEEYMCQQICGQIKNGISVREVWIFNDSDVKLIYNTKG